ncbi:uncharacterized protein [Coffea arabica]|uniref:Uncharacterized protein n=1 Tax=Coffea arabica TaxID=13443 RepID=A0ABM4WPZ3_COFAR
MQRYLSKVHQLAAYFKSFEIQRILRSQSRRANALSKLASTSFSALNKTVLVEVLSEQGYLEDKVYSVSSGDSWMDPLVRFLGHGVLPDDKVAARKIQRKSARYALRDGYLYKRSYLGPWLKCITVEEREKVLRSIHEEICGTHVEYQMLVKKALLLGYFWPTIR